ncbi:hypothetical protein TWF730_010437 [Orbilia blumenaviensis]|uniref:T6SS Phospholipase effector Tle1-like catalytic domain-containing protein n=1 Tax=Orbilia blumenaviensis TaxID=1796055 RepID=A0AAV9UN87_9PEZI
MDLLDSSAISHAVKLPPSAMSVPAILPQPQVISAQLGLLDNALRSNKPIPELQEILKIADPANVSSLPPMGDEDAIVDKGISSGILNPAGWLSALSNPTAIPEKLAAVTNVLKTGGPLNNTAKLFGAGALPAPAPHSISRALSVITSALSINNLIPGIEGTGTHPSPLPQVVSGALSTVTNALRSSNLIPDPFRGLVGGLTALTPLPISRIVPRGNDTSILSELSPESLSEAVGTVANALKSGNLIPTDHKFPEGSPLPLPGQVADALFGITKALHLNDLIADATNLPATILPTPLAQTTSETLQTIATALNSGVGVSDATALASASGLPDSLSKVISETIGKASTLPPELADAVKKTLGTISSTLNSSDQLLDATSLPGSALEAPITPAVGDTLDTLAALPSPVNNIVSAIIDSIAGAVKGSDLTSLGIDKSSKSVTFDVPDADNSTNANPLPDGHKGKRIVICCDGTWQDSDNGDGLPSNVTRFARALKSVSDDGVAQIIYYQSGIGSAYASKLGRLIAGGTGLGLSEHVREAFVFISNNYHVGDEIHIVGFSRGAFTARSIAGLMGRIGVLTRRGMENFSKIYEDYINFKLRDDDYIDTQGWERIKGVSIKTIGCWDTVGALGIPTSPIIEKCKCNDKYKFHDTDLTSSTENAFHALALDEHRMPFTPTLWRLPIPATAERHTDMIPNLKQVWFPGVHTNIGGGYKDQELSDLTLVWMIDQFIPFLAFDLDYVKSLRDSSGASGWASGAIPNSFVGVMKITTSKVRTPGGYFADPPKSPLKRAMTFGAGVFGQRGIRSVTNEEIHPSVRGRMVASNGEWCSRALFGWTCEKKIVQAATGPTERWVWTNPNTGTELVESDMGENEKLLAGTEVLEKLTSLVTVPLRKNKGTGMDKVPVDSKWAEKLD